MIDLFSKHDQPVCVQNVLPATNLKDYMLIELALQQEKGKNTTLLFSRDSSPVFAQPQSNGKLGSLVNMGEFNHLMKHEYNKFNHPLITIADAEQHLAG